MRNKRLIGILIAFGLLAIWWLISWKADQPLDSVMTKPAPLVKTGTTFMPATPAHPALPAKQSPSVLYEALVKRFISDFRTPIDFYGKVIDQY